MAYSISSRVGALPRATRLRGLRDEDKRDVVLCALADCAAVFVARVGDGPRAKLEGAGIEPVDRYPFGAIESSLGDWLVSRQGAKSSRAATLPRLGTSYDRPSAVGTTIAAR